MAMPTEPPAEAGPALRPPRDASPIPLKGKGFAIRAVAWVLDMIVLNVLALAGALVPLVALCVVGLMISLARGADGGFWDLKGDVPFVINVLYDVVMATAYGMLFEWLWGRTPAKFVLRMRVVKTDGSPPGFRAALIRALYRILDGFPFGGIALMTMRRPLCQRLGDKATDTVVVSSRHPIIRSVPPAWRFVVALGLYLVVAGIAGLVLCLMMLRAR
jgi:uncharacterized RDD family membrane protein YckC